MFELERPTPIMRKVLSAVNTGDILSLAISLEGISTKELNAPFFLSKRTIPTTLMMEAAKHGDGEVIEFLTSRGVKAYKGVSIRRKSLLSWFSRKVYPLDKACKRREGSSVVKSLLQAGAMPTIAALDTAIHEMAWETVEEILRDERLDLPYIFGKEGKTLCIALCRMAASGREDLVLRVLECDLPVHKLRNRGSVLLNHACSSGHLEIVKKLADSGVDVNKPGLNRETPLIVATLNENLDVIKCLCEYNVDPRVIHLKKYTARQLSKSADITEYLESYEKHWKRRKK